MTPMAFMCLRHRRMPCCLVSVANFTFVQNVKVHRSHRLPLLLTTSAGVELLGQWGLHYPLIRAQTLRSREAAPGVQSIRGDVGYET